MSNEVLLTQNNQQESSESPEVEELLTSEENNVVTGLESAPEEDAVTQFGEVLEQLPPEVFSIDDAEKKIDGTLKEIDEHKSNSTLNTLFDKMKKAKSVPEKIAVLFEHFTDLLQGLFEAMGDTGETVGEQLVQYETMDYTSYTAEQLGGTVDPNDQNTASLQIATKNNPYPNGSILFQLVEKIAQSDSIYKRLAWTSAYSSALVTYKQKRLLGDEHVSYKDIAGLSGKEKIESILQPGDLIVIGSNGGGFANNVLRNQSYGNDHVMMVGKDGKLYHSTMTTGEKNDKGPGFEQRDIWDELDNDRAPCRLTIVRPPESVNRAAMIAKAEELIADPKGGYSYVDAATSLLGAGSMMASDKANCGVFVGRCLEAGGFALPEEGGDPSAYLKQTGFSLEYFGKYEKGRA